jgi:hypothetical protein
VTALEPGDVVEIEWTSNINDDAHVAWLSLYYTATNPLITSTQEIGGPIVERLPLTQHGTYEWTVQGLAYIDNDYHVFARIDSNVAAEINACGKDHEYNPDPTANITGCTAMLNSNLLLPAANITGLATFFYEDHDPPDDPVLVGAQAADWTSSMVVWQPNTEVDLAGYLVRCEQGSLVRTVRSAAEHKGSAPQYESALVNGLLPGQTATCSVRAYDTSGNVSGEPVTATVVPEVVISEVTIDPGNGAILVSVDNKVTAVFPPGAIVSPTLLKLTKRALPPHPIGPLEFAGGGFNLSAYSPTGGLVTQFLDDFTITVTYTLDKGALQAAGIEDDPELNLYWWDGGTWRSLLPCQGCSHDTEGQRFIVVLDHLTEFAVLAGGPSPNWRLHMPLMMKSE